MVKITVLYVTLDEDRVLTVYFGDDVTVVRDRYSGLDYDDTWSGLLHQLSAWRIDEDLEDSKHKTRTESVMTWQDDV
jgi:hypothetical protein